MSIIDQIKYSLIVSCQAGPDEALHGAVHMAAMARAVAEGGASAIRANGVADIRAIRNVLELPILGIDKVTYPGSDVYITPTLEEAQRVIDAGADLVALDGTVRSRPSGLTLGDLIDQIHGLGVPVMADLSCMDDATHAIAAGADVLATTLAGYTEHGRPKTEGPDLEFIRELTSQTDLPVVAEGRFEHPEQVAQAFSLGAHSVVVGSAITRPTSITRRFIQALPPQRASARYGNGIITALQEVIAVEMGAVVQGASAMARSIGAGGTVFLFGSGHSHMLAEEGHYRAGGLAAVVPILASGLMLHESSTGSTLLERTPGIAGVVLDRYNLNAGDTLVVFSNSGINAAPVEAAELAKERGLTVIAVLSRLYAQQTGTQAGRKTLIDVADIVLDNHLPAGDALVELGGGGIRAAPGSTVIGAFLLNAMLAETSERLVQAGGQAPLFISANMPGGSEHNKRLIELYRSRNPHL